MATARSSPSRRIAVHSSDGLWDRSRGRGGLAELQLPRCQRRRAQVSERAVLAHEGNARDADRSVALLADDDVGLAGRDVLLVPVDQEDDVGVLLDCAALAKVRRPRPLVGPLLDVAVELRE